MSLVRQLTDADFCSDDHRKKYHELTRAALSRLMEAQDPAEAAEPPVRAASRIEEVEEPAALPVATPPPPARPSRRREPKKAPQPAVLVPPPLPPPPPLMREPEMTGFALEAGYASHMDANLLLGGDYSFWTSEIAFLHFAAGRLRAGFAPCGPVWPRFDLNSLRFRGRARSATSAAGAFFPPIGVQITSEGRGGAGLDLLGVAGSGFFPSDALRGNPGRPSHRAPIAAPELVVRPAVLMVTLDRETARSYFPSAELDRSYGKPAFMNRSAERAVLSAPEMPTGIYLPLRPAEEMLRAPMPSPGYLDIAQPTVSKSKPAGLRAGRLVAFGQPAAQIPESPFRAAGPSTAALEQMVPDLVFWSPKPIGLPRRLICLPTPTRAPRCTIVRGPASRRGIELPLAEPVMGFAVAWKSGTARMRHEPELAFASPLALAGSGIDPVFALELREWPALVLPVQLAAGVKRFAAMFHGAPLTTEPVIALPAPGRFRLAGLSDPGEATYLQLALPAVSKGAKARRSAPIEIALPVEDLLAVLPELARPSVGRGMPEADVSAAAAPGVVRPPKGKALTVPEARTPRFEPETLLPEVEGAAGRGIDTSDFLTALPAALRGRRGAPSLAGSLAGMSFSEPLEVMPAEAPAGTCSLGTSAPFGGATGVKALAGPKGRRSTPGVDFAPEPQKVAAPADLGAALAEAPCATLGPYRAQKVAFGPTATGPVTGEIPVSLPADGVLPGTTLAEAQSWLERPSALSGKKPRSVRDQTPAVPAPAPPDMAGLALGVTERSGTPISELQSLGLPKTFVMPVARRVLPGEPIAGPGVSLPDSPGAGGGHAMPELDVIPQEVRVKQRERKAAGSLRQDLPVPDTLLPWFAAEEREHILTSSAPAWQPLNPLRRGLVPAGPGGLFMTLPAELPAGALAPAAVHLSQARTSTLAVRSLVWKFITQTSGWTAFPEADASLPRPSAAALGVQSLGMARLETLARPGVTKPAKASPRRDEQEFPLNEAVQPGVPASFGFGGLITMPAMRVPPANHRGSALSPWRTEASIAGPSAGLPVFETGVPARLVLFGRDFEAPKPAKASDAQAFRSARGVVVPIQVGDGIHAPDAHLAPPARLNVTSADLEPRKAFPNARNLPAARRDASGVAFPAGHPGNAESRAIAPRRTLGRSAPVKVLGRSALGKFPVSPNERVDLPPQAAELPAPRAFALSTRLMSARPGRVPPRNTPGAHDRRHVAWQALEREATSVHYLLIASRKAGVIWPTPVSGSFQNEPPAKVFRRTAASSGPSGTQFPLPEALWPHSDGFLVDLAWARLSRIASPKWREDPATARKTVRLAPVFRPVRRPGRLPVFRLPERRSVMPSGLFSLIEAHEDVEDYGTMTMAPQYEARILDPFIPPAGSRESYGGDVSCEYLMPCPPPSPHGKRTPIGAPVLTMTTRRVEMPVAVDAIPEEYDPALAEAARRKGIEPLVGAFKSASRFFKFTVLVTLALRILLYAGGPSGVHVQGFGGGFAGIGSELYRSDSRVPCEAGLCVVDHRSGPDKNC